MAISSYNRSGYLANIVSQKELYADLDLFMPIHPNKKDIIPLTDIDAVKRSVRNIVLTNFGEKLFMPNFGGKVTDYLFENVSPFIAIALQSEIEEILRLHERRIDNVRVDVSDRSDENTYDVTINFRVINTTETANVGFELNRLR